MCMIAVVVVLHWDPRGWGHYRGSTVPWSNRTDRSSGSVWLLSST